MDTYVECEYSDGPCLGRACLGNCCQKALRCMWLALRTDTAWGAWFESSIPLRQSALLAGGESRQRRGRHRSGRRALACEAPAAAAPGIGLPAGLPGG